MDKNKLNKKIQQKFNVYGIMSILMGVSFLFSGIVLIGGGLIVLGLIILSTEFSVKPESGGIT